MILFDILELFIVGQKDKTDIWEETEFKTGVLGITCGNSVYLV